MTAGLIQAVMAASFKAATAPVYTNFWGSTSGDPTLTGAVSGRLLVAAGNRASGTPPTADGAWTLWGTEAHGSIALSQAFYYKIAAGSDAITWTNATGQRSVWEFSTAAIDTLNFSQGNTTATLDYEAQPTMTANSIVGLQVVINSAQTATSAATAGLGFTQRANRNTSISAWSGDSNTTLLSSFDPASGTFDTSGSWICGVFSVKAG